jgi:hypothetical protein
LNYETFKTQVYRLSENVVCENLKLGNFKNAVIQFEKPLTISQVSFEKNVLKSYNYDW